MNVLGLSGYCHDSAAVLVQGGTLVAAAQEERFSRRRHDPGFPAQAVAYCLDEGGLDAAAIDVVALHGAWPATHWAARFPNARITTVPHALAHAASAFLPSPFDEALVLVLDDGDSPMGGVVAYGRGNAVTIIEQRAPSLGAFYTAVTAHLGFKANSGEYKVMGLAPYGEPRFTGALLAALPAAPDGWFEVTDLDLAALVPHRHPDTPLEQIHLDLAASLQQASEQVVLRLVRALAARHPQRHLCLAGAMALNCVINGRLLRDGAFPHLWIQPAAGDAGGALGAALLTAAPQWQRTVGRDSMQGALLGPSFSQAEIEQRLGAAGARFSRLPEADLLRHTAQAIAAGQVVGWFQGRMEFGPRALGARSILADARSPASQSALNRRVKYREDFRPFAPVVPVEQAADWFDLTQPSPYMLLVTQVAPSRLVPPPVPEPRGLDRLGQVRSTIPAVTHVDGSARVQTVDGAVQPRLHALLNEFKRQTGCPVMVNTSFNIRGEPMVCTPEDAFHCFMGSHMDLLVAGDCLLRKDQQDAALRVEYRNTIEPD